MRDLKILINTWDRKSCHRKCIEILLQANKEKSTKHVNYSENSRVDTNVLKVSSSDELRNETKEAIKKMCRPLIPSTYVKKKNFKSRTKAKTLC